MVGRHVEFINKYGEQFEEIVHAYTYEAALELLKPGAYDMVFMDHDLSITSALCDPETTTEKTGSDIAKHVVSSFPPKNSPYFVVHSFNPAGRANIVDILDKGSFTVMSLPFDLLCHEGTKIEWS